jgi:hypothetical protein
MFSKKLLTVACVVGILAFGGCIFIPSGNVAPPPPPPPRLELRGIQNIQVAATSLSESNHINPSALAQAVTNNINSRTVVTGIKAEVQKEGEIRGAALKISILSETATRDTNQPSVTAIRWIFLLKISATLTKPDGQVVWSETNADYGAPEPGQSSSPDSSSGGSPADVPVPSLG